MKTGWRSRKPSLPGSTMNSVYTLSFESHLKTKMCPNSLGEGVGKACVCGWKNGSERGGLNDIFLKVHDFEKKMKKYWVPS